KWVSHLYDHPGAIALIKDSPYLGEENRDECAMLLLWHRFTEIEWEKLVKKTLLPHCKTLDEFYQLFSILPIKSLKPYDVTVFLEKLFTLSAHPKELGKRGNLTKIYDLLTTHCPIELLYKSHSRRLLRTL